MDYADDMCEIVVRHAGEKVRYFVRAVPETNEQHLLHLRDDLTWGEDKQELINGELEEFHAKEEYAARMDEESITQIIKVADGSVLFTGFIEDAIVVVHFERGILSYLPDIVTEFHEYLIENDIEFTTLSMKSDGR